MAYPETAVTLRVIGPSAPVQAGQQFNVEVRVEGASNLGALEFQYVFNSLVASATADNIRLGSFLGSTGRTTGELRLAAAPSAPHQPLYGAYSYGSAAGPNGAGQLVTITMSAVSAGTSVLNLQDVQVTSINGTPIQATIAPGAVQVVGASNIRRLYLPTMMRFR